MDEMITRRKWVKVLGICAAAGMGGCSVVGDNSQSTSLGDLAVINETENSKNLLVYVEADGEAVYLSNHIIPPTEKSTSVISANWQAEASKYFIAFSVDNYPLNTIRISDSGCKSLIIEIAESDLLIYGPGDSSEHCDSTTTK